MIKYSRCCTDCLHHEITTFPASTSLHTRFECSVMVCLKNNMRVVDSYVNRDNCTTFRWRTKKVEK